LLGIFEKKSLEIKALTLEKKFGIFWDYSRVLTPCLKSIFVENLFVEKFQKWRIVL
jgi:hypothetical protein